MEVNDLMVTNLATLARLRFTDVEKESIKGDLQKMIAFVKKMEVAKAEAVKSLLTVKPTMAEKPIMEEKTKPIFKVIKQSPLKALPILAPRVASNPSIQESPTLIASAIAEISELADQGKLKEALHRCEVLMRSDKPSAHLFYLTGLIHDTNKSYALAEQFYRKALYLEPGHIETITHLAFLLEQRGDNAAAQNLRQRAKRMKA